MRESDFKARRMDLLHQWAMEQTATMTILMVRIALVHGPAALNSALDGVREDEMGEANALPIV